MPDLVCTSHCEQTPSPRAEVSKPFGMRAASYIKAAPVSMEGALEQNPSRLYLCTVFMPLSRLLWAPSPAKDPKKKLPESWFGNPYPRGFLNWSKRGKRRGASSSCPHESYGHIWSRNHVIEAVVLLSRLPHPEPGARTKEASIWVQGKPIKGHQATKGFLVSKSHKISDRTLWERKR